MNIFFQILVTELCLINTFGIETNKRSQNITNGRKGWILPQAHTQTAKGPGWWWWVQRKGGIVFDANQATPPEGPAWKPDGNIGNAFPFKLDDKRQLNPFDIFLSTVKPNEDGRPIPDISALSVGKLAGWDAKLTANPYVTPANEDTASWPNPEESQIADKDMSQEEPQEEPQEDPQEDPQEEQFGSLKVKPQDYEISNNIPKEGGWGPKGSQVVVASPTTTFPFKQGVPQDAPMWNIPKVQSWNQPQGLPPGFATSETPTFAEEYETDMTWNYKDVNSFQSKGFMTSPGPNLNDENDVPEQTWGSLKLNQPLVKFEGTVTLPANISWDNINQGISKLKWVSSKLSGWSSVLEKYVTGSPKLGFEQELPKISWGSQPQKGENWLPMKKLPQGNLKYPASQFGNNAGKVAEETPKQSMLNFPMSGNWDTASHAPENPEGIYQLKETEGPLSVQFPMPWTTTEKPQAYSWGMADNKERDSAKSFKENTLGPMVASTPGPQQEQHQEELDGATERGETLIVEWGTPDQLIQDVMSGVVKSKGNGSNILIIKGKDNVTVWKKEGGFSSSDAQDGNLIQLNNYNYQKKPTKYKKPVKDIQAVKEKPFRDTQPQDKPIINVYLSKDAYDKNINPQKPRNVKPEKTTNDIQALLDEPLRQIQALIQKPLLSLQNMQQQTKPSGRIRYQNRDTKTRFGIRSAPAIKSLQYRSGNRETCGVDGVGCPNVLRSGSSSPKLTKVTPNSDKPKANLRAIFNEAIAKMKKHIELVESIINETKLNRKKGTPRYFRKRDERKTFRESEVEYNDKY